MLAFTAHTSYQERLNKVLSLVMDYGLVELLKISHASRDMQEYEIMSACMCVKRQQLAT